METLTVYVFHFTLVSFVVALATHAIRLREARTIITESARFFLTILIGIGIFALVVWVLEWLFIRRL